MGNTYGLGDIVLVYRFTPTYMGNTTLTPLATTTVPVHPHIHGEYAYNALLAAEVAVHPHIHGEYGATSTISGSNTGSPPHTWGIQRVENTPKQLSRFTPTYMGNTSHSINIYFSISVHPHIHGEY